MQFCAILSQIHRHKDALHQAKESVKINHLLLNDMRELTLFYIKREDISIGRPGINKYASVDHSKSQAEFKSKGNLHHNQSYQTEKSAQSKSIRNRSFSNYLSQQECYG